MSNVRLFHSLYFILTARNGEVVGVVLITLSHVAPIRNPDPLLSKIGPVQKRL
jgi:hypothetical protein